MGSCFSSQSLPIRNPGIAFMALDDRMSTFSAVHYGRNPVPYSNKVVGNGADAANFDCYLSATTTSITLHKQGEDITIAQMGASGAVLGRRDENNALISVRLTHIRELIQKCTSCRKSAGPEPHIRKDTQYLIEWPLITQRRITDQDEFVVLATAGDWEVLSIEDVVDIAGTCPRRSGAAQAVVEAAVRAWGYKYPTSMVDDCAVACLFLNPLPLGCDLS